MTKEQAAALLRQEVAARSPAGLALLALLEAVELDAYRQTARSVDALTTERCVGRGQGIRSIATLIAPTASGALDGRPEHP